VDKEFAHKRYCYFCGRSDIPNAEMQQGVKGMGKARCERHGKVPKVHHFKHLWRS